MLSCLKGLFEIMFFPFSFRRLLLILSWIGFATIIIYTNSLLNPNYNHESTSLLIALFCLINAGFLFSSLVGINKRVLNIESKLCKTEFNQMNKDELESIIRKIQPITKDNEQQMKELNDIQINMDMESAKSNLRYKLRSEHTPFEEYVFLKYRLSFLYKLSKIFSIVFSLATALIILNLTTLPMYVFWGYAAIVIILIMNFLYASSLSKKAKILRASNF
jgi:hypothetical protein